MVACPRLNSAMSAGEREPLLKSGGGGTTEGLDVAIKLAQDSSSGKTSTAGHRQDLMAA